MPSKWTQTAVVLGVLLTLALIGAQCGATATPEVVKETVVVVKEPTATPEPEPVEITWWVDPRFQYIKGLEDQTSEVGDWERILADQYEEENPHVTIKVEAIPWSDLPVKVPAAVAAGNPPDILRDYLGRTSALAYQGVVENLEPLIPGDELADYNEDILKMLTINGELHGLPDFYWAAGTLVFNRACWEEVGEADMIPTITDENPDWTFEEFEAALRAVAEPDEVWPLALQVAQEQGDYNWLTYWWGHGGGIFEVGIYSDTTFNSPAGLQAMQNLQKWYEEGLINPGAPTETEIAPLLYNGKSCAMGGGLGNLPIFDAAEKEGQISVDFDPVVAMAPSEPDETHGLAVGPTVSVVFKQDDEHKREWVIDFLRWLHRPELMREYAINSNQFPPRKSVGVPLAGDPRYEAILNMLQERPLHDLGLSAPCYPQLRVLQHPQIQAVLLGEKTPEQALQDFEREAEQVLSQCKFN